MKRITYFYIIQPKTTYGGVMVNKKLILIYILSLVYFFGFNAFGTPTDEQKLAEVERKLQVLDKKASNFEDMRDFRGYQKVKLEMEPLESERDKIKARLSEERKRVFQKNFEGSTNEQKLKIVQRQIRELEDRIPNNIYATPNDISEMERLESLKKRILNQIGEEKERRRDQLPDDQKLVSLTYEIKKLENIVSGFTNFSYDPKVYAKLKELESQRDILIMKKRTSVDPAQRKSVIKSEMEELVRLKTVEIKNLEYRMQIDQNKLSKLKMELRELEGKLRGL